MKNLITYLATLIALSITVGCGDVESEASLGQEDCCERADFGPPNTDVTKSDSPMLSDGAGQTAKTSFPHFLDWPSRPHGQSQIVMSDFIIEKEDDRGQDQALGVVYGKARVIKGESGLRFLSADDELPLLSDTVLTVFPVIGDDHATLVNENSDTVFGHIDAQMLGALKLTADGNFKVELPEGKYSIVASTTITTKDGQELQVDFCNIESRDGALCEVIVRAGDNTRFDLTIE